ncbi:MAG TPA: M15 family metallopeptidase [Sphingobacteriaceae bacterium]
MRHLRVILIALLLQTAADARSQQNPYDLYIVADPAEYNRQVRSDRDLALVTLKEAVPGVVYDIRYATVNNFMGQAMYGRAAAYLRRPAAQALRLVQAELKSKGLGIKIYDAYRPYSVTVAFYEKALDTIFVASPKRGSKHNRGCAVDLTIIDLNTGEELAMPTPYDDFTEKAHADYAQLPADVIRNRELLKRVMTKYGFEIYADEWWHYDYKDWRRFPLMDLSFDQLEP